VTRRAMHAAVFEAGWDSQELMTEHRQLVSKQHQGKGREIISLDWTLSHHEYGLEIYRGSSRVRRSIPTSRLCF
jgi:hypothetical protein